MTAKLHVLPTRWADLLLALHVIESCGCIQSSVSLNRQVRQKQQILEVITGTRFVHLPAIAVPAAENQQLQDCGSDGNSKHWSIAQVCLY